MECLTWTPSYAKLCVFIRLLLLFYGRQGRMIASLLVNHSQTRKELSVMKFGTLFIWFSRYILILCGSRFGCYRVGKGQSIVVPISLINRDKSIWGEDAATFKFVFDLNFVLQLVVRLVFFFSRPERWENIPNAASSIPGVWANQLTFIGGPRACIGYRFSLVE